MCKKLQVQIKNFNALLIWVYIKKKRILFKYYKAWNIFPKKHLWFGAYFTENFIIRNESLLRTVIFFFFLRPLWPSCHRHPLITNPLPFFFIFRHLVPIPVSIILSHMTSGKSFPVSYPLQRNVGIPNGLFTIFGVLNTSIGSRSCRTRTLSSL